MTTTSSSATTTLPPVMTEGDAAVTGRGGMEGLGGRGVGSVVSSGMKAVVGVGGVVAVVTGADVFTVVVMTLVCLAVGGGEVGSLN